MIIMGNMRRWIDKPCNNRIDVKNRDYKEVIRSITYREISSL